MSWRSAAAVGLVLGFAAGAAAQPPEGAAGRPSFSPVPVPLVIVAIPPDVRADLGTTEEQNAALDEIAREFRESSGRPGEFASLRDLPAEERSKRMKEVSDRNTANRDKANRRVAEVLGHEKTERLKQIELQRASASVFLRPEVAERLALSDEQREKLREVARAASGPSNFAEMTPEERRAEFGKMAERRTKTNADALALLTEEQKKAWDEMQGKKLEFRTPSFGPPTGERRRPPGAE